MNSPSSAPRTPRLYHSSGGGANPAFSAGWALVFVLAAVATLLVTSVIALALGARIELAIAVGQLGLVIVPVAAMIGQGQPSAVLGLRRTDARHFGAAALIGVSAWYLNMHLVDLLSLPEGDALKFAQLLEEPSLPLALLTIGLAPAICEEIVFRGVLTRGLATRFHPWAAVVIAAAIFALYHVKPIQMPSTFTLGLVFGALTLRSRSAVPAMLAHFLNNACALVVSRGDVPGLASWIADHGVISVIGAAVMTIGGCVLFAWPDPPARGGR